MSANILQKYVDAGVKIVLPDGRDIVLREAVPYKNYFQRTHIFIGSSYGHERYRYISTWDNAAWPSMSRRLPYVLVTNMSRAKKWALYTRNKSSELVMESGWPKPRSRGKKLMRSLAVVPASIHWPLWYRFFTSPQHSSLTKQMNFVAGIVGNAVAPCMARYIMKHVPACNTLVDIFCGGGGFSLGAAQACKRLKHMIGVDIDPLLKQSYVKNMSTFPKRSIKVKMLACKAPTNIRGLLGMLNKKFSKKHANLRGFHIHQSPPCQDFVLRGGNSTTDLTPYLNIMKHAAQMGATCSMEENKAAASRVLEWRSKQKKSVRDTFHVYVLNAHNYGCPSNRVRCIVTTFPLKVLKKHRR